MAVATSVKDGLVSKFQAEQATLGQASSKAVGKLWTAGFRWSEARSSWATIRPGVLKILNRQYTASAASGVRYYQACRVAAGLPTLGLEVPILRLDPKRAAIVVDSTGLGAFLHSMGTGARFVDAWAAGQSTLEGAIQRLTLAGGREMVLALSAADPASIGVRRVTRGTCEYCENLASEGFFDAADHAFDAHPDCECQAEPGFSGAGNVTSAGSAVDTGALDSDLGEQLGADPAWTKVSNFIGTSLKSGNLKGADAFLTSDGQLDDVKAILKLHKDFKSGKPYTLGKQLNNTQTKILDKFFQKGGDKVVEDAIDKAVQDDKAAQDIADKVMGKKAAKEPKTLEQLKQAYENSYQELLKTDVYDSKAYADVQKAYQDAYSEFAKAKEAAQAAPKVTEAPKTIEQLAQDVQKAKQAYLDSPNPDTSKTYLHAVDKLKKAGGDTGPKPLVAKETADAATQLISDSPHWQKATDFISKSLQSGHLKGAGEYLNADGTLNELKAFAKLLEDYKSGEPYSLGGPLNATQKKLLDKFFSKGGDKIVAKAEAKAAQETVPDMTTSEIEKLKHTISDKLDKMAGPGGETDITKFQKIDDLISDLHEAMEGKWSQAEKKSIIDQLNDLVKPEAKAAEETIPDMTTSEIEKLKHTISDKLDKMAGPDGETDITKFQKIDDLISDLHEAMEKNWSQAEKKQIMDELNDIVKPEAKAAEAPPITLNQLKIKMTDFFKKYNKLGSGPQKSEASGEYQKALELYQKAFSSPGGESGKLFSQAGKIIDDADKALDTPGTKGATDEEIASWKKSAADLAKADADAAEVKLKVSDAIKQLDEIKSSYHNGDGALYQDWLDAQNLMDKFGEGSDADNQKILKGIKDILDKVNGISAPDVVPDLGTSAMTAAEKKQLGDSITSWKTGNSKARKKIQDDIIKTLKGDEDYYSQVPAGTKTIAKAILNDSTDAPELYRGMAWNLNDSYDAAQWSKMQAMLSDGKMSLAPSSFSTDTTWPLKFQKGFKSGSSVKNMMITVQDGSRGLDIEDLGVQQFEKEWLAGGQYDVVSVKQVGDSYNVILKQVKSLDQAAKDLTKTKDTANFIAAIKSWKSSSVTLSAQVTKIFAGEASTSSGAYATQARALADALKADTVPAPKGLLYRGMKWMDKDKGMAFVDGSAPGEIIDLPAASFTTSQDTMSAFSGVSSLYPVRVQMTIQDAKGMNITNIGNSMQYEKEWISGGKYKGVSQQRSGNLWTIVLQQIADFSE